MEVASYAHAVTWVISLNRWDQTKKTTSLFGWSLVTSEFRTQRKSQQNTDPKSVTTQCLILSTPGHWQRLMVDCLNYTRQMMPQSNGWLTIGTTHLAEEVRIEKNVSCISISLSLSYKWEWVRPSQMWTLINRTSKLLSLCYVTIIITIRVFK